MGHMRDHAIVVSHWSKKRIKIAHKKAVEILGADRVSPVMGPYTNEHCSFFIPPDGSKEGWAESTKYDDLRAEFKAWLHDAPVGQEHYCKFVEVQFADDYDRHEVTDSN